MEMTTAKTIGVFVVIFGCFAILYPKIFHPMIVQMFGASPKKTVNENPATVHPRERMPRPPSAGPGPGHGPLKSHMRAGVHPGMRAAAEMKRQAAEQGSGKGMMGMILPMYAVGIIIYLVYTMTKVFMKNKDGEPPEEGSGVPGDMSARFQPSSYTYEKQGRFQADLADDADFLLSKKEKLEELEQLLAKAEDKRMTDTDMRLLKDRLAETESQMARILKAMEHVQTRVRDGIDAKIAESDARKAAEDELQLKRDDGLRQRVHPAGDSPDMESYEIVGKGAKEKDTKDTEKKNAEVLDPNTALDSESSGRESDDEDSQSVGLDDSPCHAGEFPGFSAGLGMPGTDPLDVLGLDAQEVEIVGSLAKAFHGDDFDDEPVVETLLSAGDSSDDNQSEGLRKRLPAEKTDS